MTTQAQLESHRIIDDLNDILDNADAALELARDRIVGIKFEVALQVTRAEEMASRAERMMEKGGALCHLQNLVVQELYKHTPMPAQWEMTPDDVDKMIEARTHRAVVEMRGKLSAALLALDASA